MFLSLSRCLSLKSIKPVKVAVSRGREKMLFKTRLNDGDLQQSWKQSMKKEEEQNSKSFQRRKLLKEEKGVWL